jgi:hypothetical protein
MLLTNVRCSLGNRYVQALVVMTASPQKDDASQELKIEELTKALLLARSELDEAREQQATPQRSWR